MTNELSPEAKEVSYWLIVNCKAEPTRCGSRVTCDPPPIDTDEDVLVHIPNSACLSRAVAYLETNGWKWEGNCEHYQTVANKFMSYRKGTINLIISKNPEFVDKHKTATHVCKTLNVMNKSHRIAIFQAVLYNNRHG